MPTVSAEQIEKPAVEEVSGDIEWVYDYARGKIESQRTGKPMLVVFR